MQVYSSDIDKDQKKDAFIRLYLLPYYTINIFIINNII